MTQRVHVPLLVLCVLLFGRVAFAEAPESRRILVQRVEAVGVAPDMARSIEEGLVLELGRRAKVTVVSPAELEQTVKAATLSAQLGCDDLDRCMVEIERKLQVKNVLAGKVSRLGGELFVTAGLVDLSTRTVGRRVLRQHADLRGLLATLPSLVDELLGLASAKPAFQLALGEELKLAVMPLSARGVPESTADAMTQILSAELNQISGIRVISRDDIRAMLQQVELESKLGCNANLECIVEIGAALGLSKLVTGTVGRVTNTYIVSMQLVDIRKAEVENRVLETFEGDADELNHAVKLSAYQLAGINFAQRRGDVDFTFNVPIAAVRLGDRSFKLEHSQLGVRDLSPGRYSLVVVANQNEYFPLRTDVYVMPGVANVRAFQVSDRPAPWYAKWWVWAIAGAVVVGAVTAAIVVAEQPKSNTGTGLVTVGFLN